MTPLRLATRGSPLALWQAEFVARSLAPQPVRLVIVRTEGDRVQSASLADIGGRGVFTKEVQIAVLSGDADLAVHSLKDLPTEPTPGLTLAATPERGPAGDVLVSNRFQRFDQLPEGARVATGSMRRRAMLRHRRPDLALVDIRGNIDTRLNKLDRDDLDAILLAEAGLARLGLSARIREVLDPSWMIRAVGQGALGIECRSDDTRTVAALAPLNHARTQAEVRAERAFLRRLGGGCQTPIAAAGRVAGAELVLDGVVLSPCGGERIDAHGRGPADDPDRVGHELAEVLLARGAGRLLT